MKYYIPEMVFSMFENDGIIIKWSGKGGCVGVIPVYNSREVCLNEHPQSKIIVLDIPNI